MSNRRPLELASFGLTTELEEDANILDVMVLIRHVDPDCGHDGIYIATTPGTSWLIELGLVTSAQEIIKSGLRRGDDE